MTTSLIIPCSNQGTNIKSISPLDAAGRNQLADIGINYAVVPHDTKSIQLLILNKVYTGVGLQNQNGGLEFYCSQLINDLCNMNNSHRINSALKEQQEYIRSMKVMRRSKRKMAKQALKEGKGFSVTDTGLEETDAVIPQTITFKSPGISFYPFRKGQKSSSCCIFSSFLDYMSYLTLLKENVETALPSICDCIVVNNVSNFPNALLDCEDYKHIYCLFPTTDVGKMMTLTIRDRNKGRCSDTSKVYSDYLDLHEYMTKQKQ